MTIEVAGLRNLRTLFLFPGALGDMICAQPAIAWLGREGPVTLRARGPAADVARFFPQPPIQAPLDAREVDRLFAPLGSGAAQAPEWIRRFGRIESFTGSRSEPFCARLAGVPGARIHPFPARSDGGAAGEHAVDEMLGAVSQGNAAPGTAPLLRRPENISVSGAKPHLLVHPGSGGQQKRASRAIFVDLVRHWQASTGGDCTLLLGPAESTEASWWRAEVEDVCCPTDVADLVGRVAGANAFVGNDAGPSHVAAALGTPTVVLFTKTHPTRFGPRGARVRHFPIGLLDDCVSRELRIAVQALLP